LEALKKIQSSSDIPSIQRAIKELTEAAAKLGEAIHQRPPENQGTHSAVEEEDVPHNAEERKDKEKYGDAIDAEFTPVDSGKK
jgi:hypothetical protein